MIHTRSFHQLRTLYKQGTLTPSQVTESALEHAQKINQSLNAFALIDQTGATEQAALSTKRWSIGKPLSRIDGMVIAVKEFAAVQGWPTRRGSLLTDDTPSTFDSPFVSRLKAAGAILLGKTRAPELNWKGVTDSPGFGITRNPIDPELTPGGSSGGCSAAVAAGVVRVSMGSDAAGSVRIPAAFTGVLGLKPSQGRIPVVPYPSQFSGLAHFGPIGRCAQDISDVLEVVSGTDPNDWTSMAGNARPFVSTDKPDNQTDPLPNTLRVGVLDSNSLGQMHPAVAQGLQQFVQTLETMGLSCTPVNLPLNEATQAAGLLYRWGCAQSVKWLAGQQPYSTVFDPEKLDPGLLEYISYADTLNLNDFTQALAQKDLFSARLNMLMEHYDVLLLPTVGILPFNAGRNTPDPDTNQDWLSWNSYTPAFNLVRNPVLSYPVWPNGSRMPVGVQLVAKPLEESTLLELADTISRTAPDCAVG